ncbi:MAG TPA: PIN domain nuclease [Syntrophales bacterium]|nr:PIN domain nuclease [Syntrophales bacterium]HOU78343.1 PIN domain nuclease [Syntrophales bacterium]HQG35057.1 PIN domain nuclease [Syntrophales bacterium]
MIIIDTSAMIEFINRTGTSVDRTVEQLVTLNAEVALAQVTLTEILQGIKDERDYLEVKTSLLAFPCLTLPGTKSYVAAAELYRACRKKGLTVRSTVDLLIAQTALETNAQLLHNDRDFDAIACVCGLKIYPLLP